MKKNDLKKMCLLGLTCGASLAAQGSANAAEGIMVAGGCASSPSRSYQTQVSDNYIPSGHSCSSASQSGGYYVSPGSAGGSCSSQPMSGGYYQQGSGCSSARSAGGYNQQGQGNGGFYSEQGQGNGSYYPQQGQGNGGYYSQQGTRNFNTQNQQWGQNDPNAGNSKNFPSTMQPAQGSNPTNNSNLNSNIK